jgi:hypothetical protein
MIQINESNRRKEDPCPEAKVISKPIVQECLLDREFSPFRFTSFNKSMLDLNFASERNLLVKCVGKEQYESMEIELTAFCPIGLVVMEFSVPTYRGNGVGLAIYILSNGDDGKDWGNDEGEEPAQRIVLTMTRGGCLKHHLW